MKPDVSVHVTVYFLVTDWKSMFTHLFIPHSITYQQGGDNTFIKYYCTFLLLCVIWCFRSGGPMGVDGLGKDSNIAGGLLWEVRVYTLCLGVWRGSSFLMLKPCVVIDGTICLELQKREESVLYKVPKTHTCVKSIKVFKCWILNVLKMHYRINIFDTQQAINVFFVLFLSFNLSF